MSPMSVLLHRLRRTLGAIGRPRTRARGGPHMRASEISERATSHARAAQRACDADGRAKILLQLDEGKAKGDDDDHADEEQELGLRVHARPPEQALPENHSAKKLGPFDGEGEPFFHRDGGREGRGPGGVRLPLRSEGRGCGFAAGVCDQERKRFRRRGRCTKPSSVRSALHRRCTASMGSRRGPGSFHMKRPVLQALLATAGGMSQRQAT